MVTFSFPQGFALGTATAAHQIEGGNTNSDYWLYENIADTEFTEPSADACDHLHRYSNDIALLAELGFSSMRFSIEWARIEPEPGVFSKEALDHYRMVLDTCHEFGMDPLVTLHHFTSPAWLIGQGGWESDTTSEYFARYAGKVASELGDRLNRVCTINEANTGRLTATTAIFGAPELRRQAPWAINSAKALDVHIDKFSPWNLACSGKAVDVIMNAHHLGLEAIKSARPEIEVGITLATQDIQAVQGGEENARRVRYEVEDQFLEQLVNDDFVGVQTYTRMRVGPKGLLGPEDGVELTQLGYEFYPDALEATIRRIADFTKLPVIVTENGVGTEDDSRRIAYVERALQGVINCIEDGVDVRGYYCWSALDNFEWEFGYRPKFGLIEVHPETKERLPKPSAYWLGNVARMARYADPINDSPVGIAATEQAIAAEYDAADEVAS